MILLGDHGRAPSRTGAHVGGGRHHEGQPTAGADAVDVQGHTLPTLDAGDADTNGREGSGDADDRDDAAVPSDTAAAVAYWHRRDPSLHPADIAARIGRSERTVRRYWPPAPQRTANGHDASRLAERVRAS